MGSSRNAPRAYALMVLTAFATPLTLRFQPFFAHSEGTHYLGTSLLLRLPFQNYKMGNGISLSVVGVEALVPMEAILPLVE